MRFRFNPLNEWGRKTRKEEERHFSCRRDEDRRVIDEQMDEVIEMPGTVYRVQKDFPQAQEINVDRVITLLQELHLCEQGGVGICPSCTEAVSDAVLLIEVGYGDR